MLHRHGKSTSGFTVAEVADDAHRSWRFCFAEGATPRFWATLRHGARSVSWPDIRRKVVSCDDLNTLPEGIAAWLMQLTGGAMSRTVADEAAVRIGRHLATNIHSIEQAGRRLPRTSS